ncbi:MAG: hypothetical protein II642_09935, partial [Firmicutes bacterium]|nr:hypothetical protein [Bacillota bacterium]
MKKRHLLFSRKQEKQLEEYQRDLIETHFQEVNAMYRQIRGWRHDYRNHIQTMKAYAADQNWDALVAYLNLLDTDLHTAGTCYGVALTGTVVLTCHLTCLVLEVDAVAL